MNQDEALQPAETVQLEALNSLHISQDDKVYWLLERKVPPQSQL